MNMGSAPRITPGDIEAQIVSEHYFTAGQAVEHSSALLGRKIARQHAVDKMWPLLGYELRSRLSQAPVGHGG